MNYTIKLKEGGEIDKFKCRWVAGGHRMRPGIHYGDTSSPTPRAATIRMLAATAAAARQKLKQADLPGAYLHSDLAEGFEPIFFRAPKDAPEDLRIDADGDELVFKLLRNWYGHPQGSVNHWHNLVAWAKAIGFTQSKYDPCSFHRNGLKLVVYSDDCLYTGTPDELKAFENDLKAKWGKCGPKVASLYLGISFCHHEGGDISLNMADCLQNVQRNFARHLPAHAKDVPLPPGYVADKNHCLKAGLVFVLAFPILVKPALRGTPHDAS